MSTLTSNEKYISVSEAIYRTRSGSGRLYRLAVVGAIRVLVTPGESVLFCEADIDRLASAPRRED